MTENVTRCAWVNLNKPHYVQYHDTEWGVPVHDERTLFEMLILEGAQAGLNWESILVRREGYRAAFHNFDIVACSNMTDAECEALMSNQGIIRNRLKIWSVRKNALVFMAIQKEFGSFDAYLWAFVGGVTEVNRPAGKGDFRATSPQSDALSKDLKKRGMSFVGSTIIYAYMQATGLVDDHMAGCFKAT
jgi:DNA-3-methyladenine glycosylase I